MDKRGWSFLIIGIIVLVLAFAAFQLSSDSFYSLSSQSYPVIFAGIFPLTGTNTSEGSHCNEGLSLAVDEINSKGGINSHPINLLVEDTSSNNTNAVSAYNKLSSIDKAKYYFITLSGATLGVAPLAEKNKDVLFNIGSASSKISSAGDYIFKHNLLPQDETVFLADKICNKFGFKEVGLFFVNAESGQSYKQLFDSAYLKCGNILDEEAYEVGAVDFKTQITKLKASNVKAVVLITTTKDAGSFLNQAKELGLNTQFFGVYAIEGPVLIETAHENANGLIYSHFFVETPTQKFQSFKQAFVKTYGKEPDFYSALSYDAAYLLAEAIKHCANPSDSTCVKNELYKIQNYDGVTGNISIDANGDTKKEVILKTVKDGKFVLYEAG